MVLDCIDSNYLHPYLLLVRVSIIDSTGLNSTLFMSTIANGHKDGRFY